MRKNYNNLRSAAKKMQTAWRIRRKSIDCDDRIEVDPENDTGPPVLVLGSVSVSGGGGGGGEGRGRASKTATKKADGLSSRLYAGGFRDNRQLPSIKEESEYDLRRSGGSGSGSGRGRGGGGRGGGGAGQRF